MAIYKNNVAVKTIFAWVNGQIDLNPSDTFIEDPEDSGLFLVDDLTESPTDSGLFIIPDVFNIGELTERQITRVYYWDELGQEHIVFDGTQSQIVFVPSASATAAGVGPVVSSSPDDLEYVEATATAEANAPVVNVSVSVSVPTTTATAQSEVPEATAGRVVEPPTATAQAQAENIRHSPNIEVPSAAATAGVENPTIQIEGSNYITSTTAASTAKAEAPTVTASRNVDAPTSTAQGAAVVPVYNRSRTITGVTATASADANAPTITTKGYPMGMRKVGNQSFASSTSTSPIKVTGWTNKLAWDKTVIVDDGMVMNGSMTNATLVVRGKQTAAIGTRGFRVFINGVDIGVNVPDEGSETSITGLNLVAGDRIELYTYNNGFSGRTVEEGDTVTYMYITQP